MKLVSNLFVGLSLIGLPVLSSASFDLALISDSGTDSIQRYDPISGTYLGSFGGGILVDPKGVVVNQAQNRAFVLDATARISTWDYNTGEFISSFNLVGIATYMNANSDGTLNIALADRVRRITQGGAFLTEYVRNGTFGVQQGIVGGDGFFYMSTRTGDSPRLERFTASGTFLAGVTWVADRVLSVPTSGTPSGSVYNAINAFEYGGSMSIEYDHLDFGPSGVMFTNTTVLSNPSGIAPGHAGMTYIAGKIRATPTQGGVLRFDRTTGVIGTAFGQATLQNPTGIATVVAPEPGTMIALGIGIGALLRKRKNSAR